MLGLVPKRAKNSTSSLVVLYLCACLTLVNAESDFYFSHFFYQTMLWPSQKYLNIISHHLCLAIYTHNILQQNEAKNVDHLQLFLTERVKVTIL